MPLQSKIIASRICFIIGIFLCPAFYSDAQAAEIIKIGGAGAGLGTMKLLGEAFEKKNPNIKVQVFPSLGSSGGILALSRGALDIATSSRAVRPEERASELVAFGYARTPFLFVTHKNVGKDELNTSELEDIYLGKTENWPDGKRIRLVLRPETDSDTTVVKSISKGVEQALNIARSSKGKILAVTDQDCTDIVAKSEGSLGTSTLTQVVAEKLPLKVLAFDGAKPSLKAISDGTYRLSKTLYLVTAVHPRPSVRRFTEFVFSSEGRRILSNTGNLAVSPSKSK